ncbi:hypothetical protein [Sorangium sp. So ce131]|uniref:hypothetical protein n=1 Tax=Sorangium sp. So ce131 TaxID=3133282 RepID=UPI003F61B061
MPRVSWRWSRRDGVHGMYQGQNLQEEGVAAAWWCGGAAPQAAAQHRRWPGRMARETTDPG